VIPVNIAGSSINWIHASGPIIFNWLFLKIKNQTMIRYQWLILLMMLGFYSCSPRHESFECGEETAQSGRGKIFLTGAQMLNSSHFTDILKMSGIHSEGYTLMITGEKNLEESYIKRFNEMLNFNQLHANHIFGISPDDSVSPANRVALENARLIFFALTSREYHNAVLNDTKLMASFEEAWKQGATIVAVADGADLLGDFVVVPPTDTASNKKYVIRKGLGLVSGVAIDKSKTYNEEKQWFANNLGSDVTFLGIDENSMLQVCGSEIVIIIPGGLMVLKNNAQYAPAQFKPKSKINLN
jgi:hypothetical protein